MSPSVGTLGRIALGVTLVGTTGLWGIRWSIQSKIRESATYQQALQYLKEQPKIIELLGEPIKDKRVEIGDNDCYGRKDNITWVNVPLQGRKRKGNLYYWVVSNVENDQSRLGRVELSIERTSVGRILLREDPGDQQTAEITGH